MNDQFACNVGRATSSTALDDNNNDNKPSANFGAGIKGNLILKGGS
jgi:hypothetical protein